ncbi:MAG: hypothetical protein WA085_18325 [Sphingobium sp.]|uniref:hypothetical protein n=1 Tax=Sphingobium sp. CECT 9361 TaxID=2845384 RepID=UPI001E455E50|nr:hypothetical protein [Sphingobium sp. CECT 9361]
MNFYPFLQHIAIVAIAPFVADQRLTSISDSGRSFRFRRSSADGKADGRPSTKVGRSRLALPILKSAVRDAQIKSFASSWRVQATNVISPDGAH